MRYLEASLNEVLRVCKHSHVLERVDFDQFTAVFNAVYHSIVSGDDLEHVLVVFELVFFGSRFDCQMGGSWHFVKNHMVDVGDIMHHGLE